MAQIWTSKHTAKINMDNAWFYSEQSLVPEAEQRPNDVYVDVKECDIKIEFTLTYELHDDGLNGITMAIDSVKGNFILDVEIENHNEVASTDERTIDISDFTFNAEDFVCQEKGIFMVESIDVDCKLKKITIN